MKPKHLHHCTVASTDLATGLPVNIRLNLHHDPEVNVYTATSTQVKGLVLEAPFLEEIKAEARRLVPELWQLARPQKVAFQ